jgi:hypothetical protein
VPETKFDICPQCGKKSYVPDVVIRTGKGGKRYEYRRYRHPKKWGTMKVHYQRIKGRAPEGTPDFQLLKERMR